jgi:hypothetical protein
MGVSNDIPAKRRKRLRKFDRYCLSTIRIWKEDLRPGHRKGDVKCLQMSRQNEALLRIGGNPDHPPSTLRASFPENQSSASRGSVKLKALPGREIEASGPETLTFNAMTAAPILAKRPDAHKRTKSFASAQSRHNRN